MTTRLLLVNSSLFGGESVSLSLAEELVEGWVAIHPDTIVERRDLNDPPIPHLTAEQFRARSRPDQVASCAEVEQVEAADVVVIAAPMVNFSIASTLKAWIDHIVWARRTFRYTPNGPEGLLKARVFVVSARAGLYGEADWRRGMDHVEPYLRSVLGFIGLRDMTFISAEGQGADPAIAARGRDQAREAIRLALLEAGTADRRAAS